MSEYYFQAFPYCFWSLAAYFQLIQHGLVLANLHQQEICFTAIVGGGGDTHPQCIIKKQSAPVADHLKIRWHIVPDCIIDATSSIKTLRITINFNWDKIA